MYIYYLISIEYENILAFFLLLGFYLIQAQNDPEVDSLLAIYNDFQIADTIKIGTVDEVVTYYLYNDLEKAETYTIEQMELSQKNNYNLGIAMAHFNFAAIYDLSNKLDSADFYYGKANEYYLSVDDKYMIATCRSGLANIAFQRGAYEGIW